MLAEAFLEQHTLRTAEAVVGKRRKGAGKPRLAGKHSGTAKHRRAPDGLVQQHTVDADAVKLALAADLEEPVEQTPEASEGYDEIAEIRKALTQCRGRYSDAAKILGMGRTTLWRKIRQYGLK